jgi:hypothetical protein
MRICLRRREFIAALGGAAAGPLAARAQRRALPVIGYLSSRTAESEASMLVSFRRGLSDVGYAEGRNVAIEYRFTDGRYALADPAARSGLAELGYEAFPRERQTPETLGALQKADAEKWWPIIKELGLKAQ